jgi:hypothetical protein
MGVGHLAEPHLGMLYVRRGVYKSADAAPNDCSGGVAGESGERCDSSKQAGERGLANRIYCSHNFLHRARRGRESLIARQFILMSRINDVDNPGCPSRFALDCELLSTASFSPIDAFVPNVENEASTGFTIEPISLRVSLLESFIQIPYIPHF